jgi:hypothetical protein
MDNGTLEEGARLLTLVFALQGCKSTAVDRLVVLRQLGHGFVVRAMAGEKAKEGESHFASCGAAFAIWFSVASPVI